MQSEKNSTILRILPGFADKFKPDAIQYENKLLTKLSSHELANLSFQDLLFKCNNIYETITITQKDTLSTELEIINYAESRKWYESRAGQVTASFLKKAISTKIESSSLSQIKNLCYRYKFRNVAIDWGTEQEKPAQDCFVKNSKKHTNFTVRESGLVINLKWSYIDTSP